MSDPLVSICIPVYNRRELIVKAVESCIRQSYQNIEVIIVDNCSTDGTYERLLADYGSFANIHVYQNVENLGPVRNWLKCLELSNGDFIKILFSEFLQIACFS